MKLRIVFSCFLFFFAGNAVAQQSVPEPDSAHIFIDSALQFARKYSLYRDKVNWQNVEDSIKLTSKAARSTIEAIPSLQLLFRLLGDKHGAVVYAGKFYRGYPKRDIVDTIVHKALLKKYFKDNTAESVLLEPGYGYLLIPDNNPTREGDVDRIGQDIQARLNKLNPSELKGLIIDLRVNPGGDMFAMLAGLTEIFEPGELGAFVDPVSHTKEKWGTNGYYSWSDSLSHTRATVVHTFSKPGLKIVVLISPETKSSGEAVAISFKGRPNTLFIGEPTGGYTTSNYSFQFTDSCGLFLSASIEADRNGTIYWDNITPDEVITGGDNFDDLKADKKVIAALNWLKGWTSN
jgi:hypothetical protein